MVPPLHEASAAHSPSADARTPAELLATPVQYIEGVGHQWSRRLARLNIHTAGDLLFCFPRDYEDLSDRRAIADLDDQALQSVCGTVEEIDGSGGGIFRKSRVGVLIGDDTGQLRAIWFNQPWMRDKFHVGQRVLFSARPRLNGQRWEMSHPRVRWFDESDDLQSAELLPVYPLTEGVKQHQMRQLIRAALDQFAHVLEEVFPVELLDRYRLMPLADALPTIHRPKNPAQLAQARRRFIFQELFVLQLAITARRWQQRVGFRAPALPATARIDARIRRLFPFELTADQQQAISEVAADMALLVPMNRLLQGDVGSGKTVVALYATLLSVAHGYQVALMAPTEILARQHADTLGKLLEESRVRCQLLTGGLTARQRAAAGTAIAEHEVDVVIGTHAILQESVEFAKLGLVVIDEQHKFGVRQRAALRESKHAPHYLVMTATPIRRTVTMALFGDLDVSTLREMPPGRQPTSTYLVEPNQQAKWWEFVRDRLREGRQAYVVAPLVDESEHVAVSSVATAFEQLTNGELEAFRTGLIHGRMPPAEKEQAMAEFRSGQTQVLVSTSVIEVGVDVPNASVIVIDSAEHFGLAQLHQLRGRVGRGTHPGFCGVLLGEELNDAATERLEAFAGTTDGFELSETDFQLRGPGDLFGTRQHGLPPLRVADLRRDDDVLQEARRESQALFSADPGLADPEHAALRRQMLVRYGQVLELADVG